MRQSLCQQKGDRVKALEELLAATEPHATFHDADVVDASYNPAERSATLTAHLCVGDPDAAPSARRERRRTGVLELRRVAYWRQDPPEPAGSVPGTWLADDGPLAEAPGDLARELASQLQRGEVGWYLFFGDSNSFIYWVAADVTFRWLTPGEPAV
jgi:hypothetical protein